MIFEGPRKDAGVELPLLIPFTAALPTASRVARSALLFGHCRLPFHWIWVLTVNILVQLKALGVLTSW